jgi:replicative DNA helicase
MIERSFPQSIEAEQAVLGAVFLKPTLLPEINEILASVDFYRPEHGVLYGHLQKMSTAGEAIDLVTVTESMRSRDLLDKVGGLGFLTAINQSVPTAANARHYVDIVLEKSRRRQIIDAGTAIVNAAYDESIEIEDVLDQSENTILAVTNKEWGKQGSSMTDILLNTFSRIDALCKNKGGITGIPTGFVDFDRLTAGLHPSDFIIIAARPSMGKTAFALNIAAHVALHQDKHVALFSLEMSDEQITERILCAEGAVDSQKLRVGELNKDDWDRMLCTAEMLGGENLQVDDTPEITAAALRQKARKIKSQHGLDLIIIDYLQLMEGSKGKTENRQQEIAEISRSLKALARELNVPVIALSQLSRAVETRQDKRPMLSDLRESGSLEQDADIVAFLYRDDYYNPDSQNKNITDLIIAKHRNGPIDTIRLFFHKQFTKFSNLTDSKRQEVKSK